ncbi:hypothetical protein FIBSPDRAFT_857331 [Athelia psychrophila]|uniref:Uncharacterized protein n=1 Tax=Athelia psychrophila TaxID=1759441 RepID=A0A166MSE3_9AGAM|nr:hypothetical protein FIBSPDRAFT_857331 [Fibularhizoctonia sp. CBS 109695]
MPGGGGGCRLNELLEPPLHAARSLSYLGHASRAVASDLGLGGLSFRSRQRIL